MWAFFGFLAGKFFWKNFASGENQISQIFLRNHPFWMVNGSKFSEGGQFWPPKIRVFGGEPKSSFLGSFLQICKILPENSIPLLDISMEHTRAPNVRVLTFLYRWEVPKNPLFGRRCPFPQLWQVSFSKKPPKIGFLGPSCYFFQSSTPVRPISEF